MTLRLQVPPRTRQPQRISLMTSAVTPDGSEGDGPRWGQGITWEPERCSGTLVTDPCDNDKTAAVTRPSNGEFDAMAVFAKEECSAFGADLDELKARARRLLEAGTSAAIAEELWDGVQATASGWPNLFLSDAGATVLTAAAGETPPNALACLEQAVAECAQGERGMIHATAQVVTLWAADGLVRREGRQILTMLDTIVSPDAGNTGTAPSGTADNAGVAWAYATLVPFIRVSEPRIIPDDEAAAMVRDATTHVAENTFTVIAERLAAIQLDDCCRAAAGVIVPECLNLSHGD